MEKLLTKLTLVLILFQNFLIAQDTLTVYKVEGKVFLKQNRTNNNPLFKGQFIVRNDKVRFEKNSKLIALDKKGRTYSFSDSGILGYEDLLSKRNNTNNNFVYKYFKYVWNELINKSEKKENVLAGIKRGDILMTSPKNGIYIMDNKITFEWTNEDSSKPLYFILSNNATKKN